MKNWLKDNKVYFETIAATTLTLMAVIVSLAQLTIASKQNQLVESQLEISKVQVSPIFHSQTQMIRDPNSGLIEDELLTITNLGAPAFETNSEHQVHIKITISPKNGKDESKSYQFRLMGYYFGTKNTEALQGHMFTISGHKNNLEWGEFYRQFTSLADSQGYYSEILMERYLKISYRTRLNDRVTDYYHIAPVGGATKLSNLFGEEVFSDYLSDSELKPFVDISNLDDRDIFKNLWNKFDSN